MTPLISSKLFCLTFLVFISWAPVLGQTRLVKCSLVLNNGDTIRGWLNYKGSERSPESIGFCRDSLACQLTVYKVHDLRYFNVAGVEIYERAVINSNLIYPGRDSLLVDTVFLRLLFKGPRLNLYSWGQDLFFIRETGGNYELLVMNDNKDGTTPVPVAVFKNTLNAYAIKYESADLLPRIDFTGYNADELSNIVYLLNGSHGIAYTGRVFRNRPHWYFGAGAGISGITISGDKSYLGNIRFKNTVSPYLALGFDYLFSSGIGPWAARLEAAYFLASYKAAGMSVTSELDHISYALQQNNFSVNAYALYHFVNLQRFKLYGAVGVGANFASYPKNTYQDSWPENMTTNNYASLSSFWLSGNVKLGAIISNRVEIGATGIFGDYMRGGSYTFEPHTYFGWVAYRF